jgi:acyl carrier protein
MESSVEVVSPGEIKELITELLVDELDIQADLITDTATLEELDLDSLDLVEIGQIVEQKYGVRIRASDAEGVANIGDVVEMIHAKAKAESLAAPEGGEDGK